MRSSMPSFGTDWRLLGVFRPSWGDLEDHRPGIDVVVVGGPGQLHVEWLLGINRSEGDYALRPDAWAQLFLRLFIVVGVRVLQVVHLRGALHDLRVEGVEASAVIGVVRQGYVGARALFAELYLLERHVEAPTANGPVDLSHLRGRIDGLAGAHGADL